MSLSASVLGSNLANATKNITSPSDYWDKFAAALNSYLKDNTEIEGAYIGVMPNGKPSSNNGSYTWKTTCNLSGSALFSAIQNSSDPSNTQSKLSIAIQSNLIKQSIDASSVTKVILDGDVKLGCIAITFDFSSKPEKPSDTNSVYADAILKAIKSAIPIPPTMSATSVDGSKGAVTFSKQS